MAKEYILGIDPSNKASAFCLVELPSLKPVIFGFMEEDKLLEFVGDLPCPTYVDNLAVEGLSNQGHIVGKDVFDTAYLVGRILERASLVPVLNGSHYKDIKIIYRNQEKKVMCGKVARVNDKDIRNALIERFAPNVPNKGKGTKKNQGWFYGFKADIWQAYAVAITYYELYLKGGN